LKAPHSKAALLLAVVLGSVAGSGCSREQRSEAQQAEATRAPVPVTVALPKVEKVQRTVDVVGTLEANEEVTVSNKLDGRLQRVYVDLGDRVQVGQILAKLDDGDYALALNQVEGSLREAMARLGLDRMPESPPNLEESPAVTRAKADLDNARANFERLEALYEERVISRQEYDDVATKLKLAHSSHRAAIDEVKSIWMVVTDREAQVRLAKKRLQETAMLAPLQGMVAKRLVSAGEYVKVGTPLLVLVQSDPLRLRGAVPERFAAEVKLGQSVRAGVDAFPTEVFTGFISRISPAADRVSRAFTVEALIRNRDGRLKVGFFARAAILTRVDQNALTVPAAAIVRFAGVAKLFILDNEVAREREVRTGMRLGDAVEITEGLRGNERVITSGMAKLTDGVPVRAKELVPVS
jgi:RND family efflux transporter MFP subunit